MEPIAYSESEVEQPTSTDSEGENLINCSVQSEIIRGNQIRAEKVKSHLLESARAYDMHIEVLKPISARQKGTYNKCPSSKCKGLKTGPGSPPTATPSTRPNSPNSRIRVPMQDVPTKPTSSIKPKTPIRCPLRIAELAVPSKRQCIETWRAKCHTLPEYMVHRLKQHVTDQTPVVGITDAIHSFKKRKNVPAKSGSKKVRAASDDNMKEIKMLCGVFGLQISKILMTPMCITLNPHLAKLSEVIAGDINILIKTSKRFDMDKSMYYKILTEMSSKVAVWIANILEDASFKLLEEDLRVQKNTYRRLGKEDKLVTLIEKTFGLGLMSDLEEEEGPVLDFIDDLVENVVSFCEPSMDIDEFYGSSPDGSGSYERKLLYEDCEKSISSPNSTENMDFDSYSSDQNDTTIYETGESLTHYKSAIEHDLRDSPTTQSINTNEFQSGTDDRLINKLEEVEEENFNESIRNEISNILDVILISASYEEDDKMPEIDDEQYEDTHALVATVSSPLKYVVEKEILDETIEPNLSKEILNEKSASNVLITIPRDAMFEENGKIQEVDDEQYEDTHDLEGIVSSPLKDVDVVKKEISEETSESILSKENNNENNVFNLINANTFLEVKNDNNNQFDDNLNVSEKFEVVSEELFDAKSKKVKFSNNMVTSQEHVQTENSSSHIVEDDINSKELEKTSWKPLTKYDIPNIIFRQPNQDLLSDADELWPRDFIAPMIKATESVSKSVTSLGKLLESEERTSPVTTNPNINTNSNGSSITENQRNIYHVEDYLGAADLTNGIQFDAQPTISIIGQVNTKATTKYSKDESTMAEIYNVVEKPTTIDSEINTNEALKQTNDASSATTEINNNVKMWDSAMNTKPVQLEIHTDVKLDLQPCTTHHQNTQYEIVETGLEPKGQITCVNSKSFEDKLDSALKKLSSEEQEYSVERSQSGENLVVGVVKDKVKLARVLTEVKLSYKVNPDSAPSWVSRAHGEPSNESFYSEAKDKININEADYKQLCTDLDRGFQNIDMWNHWLRDMCRNVTYVEAKRGLATPHKASMKHWLQLKKNIDKDSVMWNKLNQRTRDRLKAYRNIVKKSQSSIYCGNSRPVFQACEVSPEHCTVLDRINSFDRLCVLMHRQIVSTEYCVCHCKRNPKAKRKEMELVTSNNRR